VVSQAELTRDPSLLFMAFSQQDNGRSPCVPVIVGSEIDGDALASMIQDALRQKLDGKALMQPIVMRTREMAMKCPKCGADNPDYVVYCGNCAGTIKEPEPSTDGSEASSEQGRLSQTSPLIQSGFLRILAKLCGITCALVGVIFTIVGLYGMSGGSGVIFTINDRLVDAQEGGQVFLIIGIATLLVGITLLYFGFKKKVVQRY
jgi:ribosomal protein S27E